MPSRRGSAVCLGRHNPISHILIMGALRGFAAFLAVYKWVACRLVPTSRSIILQVPHVICQLRIVKIVLAVCMATPTQNDVSPCYHTCSGRYEFMLPCILDAVFGSWRFCVAIKINLVAYVRQPTPEIGMTCLARLRTLQQSTIYCRSET